MRVRRGEIWYIERGSSVGSEQSPGRPAVVVSNDLNNKYSSVVEVVYLTTQPKRDLPTHVTIYSSTRVSTALCEQITPVSVERFGNYCGRVTSDEMADIEAAMRVSLGINTENEQCLEGFSPPALASRLTKVETECEVLRQMYDSLLNKIIKIG